MDETPLPEAPFRLLPCSECGYELRGRRVGEQCPECGWRIDAPGPAWCGASDLRTLRWASTVGWIPCILLLLVPGFFVLGVLASQPAILGATVLLFFLLMPIQLGAQFLAAWNISLTAVGARRRGRLRVWSLLRLLAFLVAFGIVGAMAMGMDDASDLTEWLLIAAYFSIPLLAVVADVMVARTLASLVGESRMTLSGSAMVLPMIAQWSLWAVYPLLLIPILGWFFAPILWTTAMAVCLWQVGALAKGCERVYAGG